MIVDFLLVTAPQRFAGSGLTRLEQKPRFHRALQKMRGGWRHKGASTLRASTLR